MFWLKLSQNLKQVQVGGYHPCEHSEFYVIQNSAMIYLQVFVLCAREAAPRCVCLINGGH